MLFFNAAAWLTDWICDAVTNLIIPADEKLNSETAFRFPERKKKKDQ